MDAVRTGETILLPDTETNNLKMKDNAELMALNYVHSMASKLWTENIPITNPQEFRQKSGNSSRGSHNHSNKRIKPVQVAANPAPTPVTRGNDYFQRKPFGKDAASQRSVPQVRLSFDNDSKTIENKKRAQLKSLPRKPPDINNVDMFPPISGTPITTTKEPATTSLNSSSVKPVSKNKSASAPDFRNPFSSSAEEFNFDPKFERTKLCNGVHNLQTQICSTACTTSESKPTSVPLSAPKPIAVKKILPKPATVSVPAQPAAALVSTTEVKKSRSAELLEQLTPEQIEKLDVLVKNYSNSLDSNICRSILAEVTFLCQLLVANTTGTVTPTAGQGISDQESFTQVAARVYFVTKVLELQMNSLVPFIATDVCQMLIDFYPNRIPKYLRKKIQKIIEIGIERELYWRNKLEEKSGASNCFSNCVIYQSETDGKNNFPNQRDCQDFSKQRDMFYTVKEIWTSNQRQNVPPSPMHPSQNYDPGYSKVRQLFQLNSSPTNLCRLAALFISQCVVEVKLNGSSGSYELSQADDNIRRILQSNPSKYEQLRQRLLAPDDISSPIVDPMAFLKYFVELANSAAFNQHLIDRAIHEILQIETEVEDMTDSIEILNQMKKSRLLAQMLGYLYFLPYRTEEAQLNRKPIAPINVEVYLQSQIALRSYQGFPIDLVSVLLTALKHKRLVFTLPWILEFLSQGDQVTFHLSKFKPVLTLVSCIYRELLVLNPEGTEITEICLENKNFLRFFCGKLFGMSTFPDSYLFHNDGKRVQYFCRVPSSQSPVSDEEEAIVLDSKGFIGSTFIPIWFRTEMKQMRSVLTSSAKVKGNIPIASPGIVKHVRPIPERSNSSTSPGVSLSQSSPESSDPENRIADVQRDLEEQFFSIHPNSMKKTVEFVAERIASNFVKQLRNQILLEVKNDLVTKRIAQEPAVIECKEQIWQRMEDFTPKRCEETVNMLLSGVVSNGVLITCQAIATRKANQKIQQWVDQHITKELFPELNPAILDMLAAAASSAPAKPAPTQASSQPGTLFQVMRLLHRTIQHLHTGRPIDPSVLDTIATDDQLPAQKPWITQRSLDLVLSIITFKPSLLTDELQVKFVKFWKQVPNITHKGILVPRNLLLFAQSSEPKQSWAKLGSLMKLLLREGLVTPQELQEDCMSLLRQDWPQDLTKRVSEFLKDVLSGMGRSCEEAEVMDWIAWYCSGNGDEEF